MSDSFILMFLLILLRRDLLAAGPLEALHFIRRWPITMASCLVCPAHALSDIALCDPDHMAHLRVGDLVDVSVIDDGLRSLDILAHDLKRGAQPIKTDPHLRAASR